MSRNIYQAVDSTLATEQFIRSLSNVLFTQEAVETILSSNARDLKTQTAQFGEIFSRRFPEFMKTGKTVDEVGYFDEICMTPRELVSSILGR